MIERNRLANIRLSGLVGDLMREYFATLDLSDPFAARDELLQVVPAIAEAYSPISAQMGLEWYEEMAIASGAAASFRAVTPPLPDLSEMATKSVKYAAGHLFRDNPQKTLEVLGVKMDKIIKEPARQTIIWNADFEDDAWWARVPTGESTCSFCMVLASRGAAYHSERSAGSREYGEENLFHGTCDCEVVRLGQFDEYPEGYLPEHIYDMYNESASRVGRNDLSAVLYDFRRRFPDLVKDGVDDPEYLERMQ